VALKPLTIRQLRTGTPEPIRGRIASPVVKIIQNRIRKEPGARYRYTYAQVRLWNEHSSGRPYSCIIKNYGSTREPTNYRYTPDSHVWVHCSCPHFKFNLEVVLTLAKSSSIYDAKPNPRTGSILPLIRNPRGQRFICKHLFALLLLVEGRDRKGAVPTI
jgi:hypothetical protein